MLFDVLAFKNDVSFWKGKKSMAGMSTRTGIIIKNCNFKKEVPKLNASAHLILMIKISQQT